MVIYPKDPLSCPLTNSWIKSLDPLNILFPIRGRSGRTKLIIICTAVWRVRPICLQSADLCLSPHLSLSGNLQQIIQANLYVWPLHLRAFTMLIYADCWLSWWLLSDRKGTLVNKTQQREKRQTGQGSTCKVPPTGTPPPLKPSTQQILSRSSVNKQCPPWNLDFNSRWCVFPSEHPHTWWVWAEFQGKGQQTLKVSHLIWCDRMLISGDGTKKQK